jgi:hypothetical protein
MEQRQPGAYLRPWLPLFFTRYLMSLKFDVQDVWLVYNSHIPHLIDISPRHIGMDQQDHNKLPAAGIPILFCRALTGIYYHRI